MRSRSRITPRLGFYEDHVLGASASRRITESRDPTKTLDIGIPICGSLCRNWYTPRTASRSLPRSSAPLARSLAQVADDRRADTCARVGACVPHVTKTRRVGPAYIRPAALEMESVFDMLRPLHFVSGPHSTLASSTSILSSQRRFSFLLFPFLCFPASASRVHALSLFRRHETSIASPINLSD